MRRHGGGGDARYVVLRPHAKGGIGQVSVALDVALNREVALKELLDGRLEEPESRARFQIEAEVTARLEHPGIVPVYAIGCNERGEPFYVMRFIKGDSFKEAVRQFHAGRGGRGLRDGETGFRLQQLLRRFIGVCDTIEYAHSRGVIHRDLKPSNVIMGKYGETLVVDWGLAKFVGRDEQRNVKDELTLRPSSHSGSTDTIAGLAVGTPAFMSPEQAEGNLDHVGFASDIYGLGATLYYLLTGRNPITDSEVTTVLRRARRGEFRRPREVGPRHPAGARGDLPECDGVSPRGPVWLAPRAGARPGALAGRRAGVGVAGAGVVEAPALGRPQPDAGQLGRRGDPGGGGDRRVSGLRDPDGPGPPPDRGQRPGRRPLDGRGPGAAADR